MTRPQMPRATVLEMSQGGHLRVGTPGPSGRLAGLPVVGSAEPLKWHFWLIWELIRLLSLVVVLAQLPSACVTGLRTSGAAVSSAPPGCWRAGTVGAAPGQARRPAQVPEGERRGDGTPEGAQRGGRAHRGRTQGRGAPGARGECCGWKGWGRLDRPLSHAWDSGLYSEGESTPVEGFKKGRMTGWGASFRFWGLGKVMQDKSGLKWGRALERTRDTAGRET